MRATVLEGLGTRSKPERLYSTLAK
jgi:hypothetical protein